ncbi:MAG: metallophosphoesterase family protein [Bacteroidetes bacterium]|nr:metallophosphoesterase family protein [Bacteroidota bacterium]
MKRIGLLSDTHGYLDQKVFDFFDQVDEIWHAGDFGTMEVSDQLEDFKPLFGVHGNIDGRKLRTKHPLDQRFICEGMNTWMTHIGGYPGRYDQRVRKELNTSSVPGLFICGHSHILKIMNDEKYKMMTMNPGATGRIGLHKIRTAIRFEVDNGALHNLEVIELGSRSQ